MTLSRPQVAKLLAESQIRPSKALGQNFVVDPNTVRKIAHLAGLGPGDRVIEIGTGLGSLTLALMDTGADVVTVEKDSRLVSVARRVLAERGANVRIIEGDALSLDWAELLRDAPTGEEPPWVLVANLPYNVATPLVVTLLENVPQIARMLVMVQREVGERMVARPGQPGYGAVSVKIAYWAKAKLAGKVPASVFEPRPNVESVLISIERIGGIVGGVSPSEYQSVREFVDAGFHTRRKMLRNSLAGLVPGGVFDQAGIKPTARAEELGVEDWRRLVRLSTGNTHPSSWVAR
ncbi:MAG TPA: 16S rRNA (adenine(1518)-N(6)/adenine(1519)-N(6))-dimethyltransferase RsmA [Acidimicrobiales bacterium]|nr:16S rRNA (adenine(1518)-N(6)/adenine(1519)-N(6))-dimethyltransferase RsmA [Acidimicrobiales bacterium]